MIAIAFGLVFIGELPDKTGIASLVLGTRFPWRHVFVGVALAFAVHVAIAVAAGSMLVLLPHRAVEAVVAALFALGAILLWRESRGGDDDEPDPDDAASRLSADAGALRVAGVSFSVILVAEWGDLTQILTANLAAKYHNPVSVGIGAVLALWTVALLALLAGRTLLRVLPMQLITRIAAVVMAVLCGVSIYSAIQA